MIFRTPAPRPDFPECARIQDAQGAFRAPKCVVLNFLNARSFRKPPIHPERTRIQDAQSGRWARIHDIQVGPGHERGLTGYPESVLAAILNILNARFQDIQDIMNAS